jgi:hypothetical protein
VTDARFPAYWLIDQRFDDLTPDELHLFTSALLWSVSNRTEGAVPERRLDRLPWRPDPRCAPRLEALNLWRPSGDDWIILDFTKTQTTAKQLEAAEKARVIDRERKAVKRATDAASAARKEAESGGEAGVRSDVRSDVQRTTKARESASASREEEVLGTPSGFVSGNRKDKPDWPSVAAIPGQRPESEGESPSYPILDRLAKEKAASAEP